VSRGFWDWEASDADAIGLQPVPRVGRFGTGWPSSPRRPRPTSPCEAAALTPPAAHCP